MSHPAHLWRVLLPSAVSLVLAAPAGAAGAFDGTYKGRQTGTLTTSAPDCQSLNYPVAIVIQDDHFTRRWGQANLDVTVAADGSFAASAVTPDRRRLRNIAIKGKIAGGVLDADIGSDLCAAHLSLTKSRS
jgi:hypothetical protein